MQAATDRADGRTGWFRKRPLLVYLVFIFCVLQIFGVTLFLLKHTAELTEVVDSGAISVQSVLAGYLYPFTLFLGGLFLLFMRKLASLFFAIYAVWGTVRLLVPTGHSASLISIAVAVLFLTYSLYLFKKGKLA